VPPAFSRFLGRLAFARFWAVKGGKVAFHVKTDVMHIVIVQPCEDGQLVAVDAVPCKLVGGFIDLHSAALRLFPLVQTHSCVLPFQEPPSDL